MVIEDKVKILEKTNKPANEVANWFRAKIFTLSSITHLKLQKLIYYSQAWMLVIYNKEMFTEDIQAWAHGPVVPEVFEVLKIYGWKDLPEILQIENTFSSEENEILNQVFATYAHLSEYTLEEMAQSDSPWIKARGDLEPEERCYVIMPKNEIYSFFKAKYDL